MLFWVLIILLILFLYFSPQTKSHPFWDSQPVVRDSNFQNIGFLYSEKPNFTYDISPFHFKYENQKITQWMSSNFSEFYHFPLSLDNILNHPHHTNISLETPDSLQIGFIHSRPYTYRYLSADYPISFVDYLCLHPDYRKRNLSTKLISHIVEKMPTLGAIFKIDKHPLPIPIWTQSNYYLLDISPTPKSIPNSSPESAFEIIQKSLLKLKFYPNLTLDEFRNHYATPNSAYRFFYIPDTICIIGRYAQLKAGPFANRHIFDIDGVFLSTPITIQIWQSLSSQFAYADIQMISYVPIGDAAHLHPIIGGTKGANLYFYLYNCSFPQLPLESIWVNFN